MGGFGSTKSSQALAADSTNRNIAVRYAMNSAVAFMANHVRVDDQLAANRDRALTGLGVDYALSKRSTIYGRYEYGDHNKAATSGAADGGGKFTNYGVGLRHTF